MSRAAAKPYHHGRLRQAVLEAAIEEIEVVGPTALSMREVARRAGVSHAAPAHHFGDKAGIFTAIAIEGYRLLTETTSAAATGAGALVQGGLAYVQFAVTHRAHFEVMFRPDLYRQDDPELIAAREASFDVMRRAVAVGLKRATPEDALGTALASWSVAHGFAVLWLNGNLPADLTDDPGQLASLVANGIVELGKITRRHAPVPIW